MKFKKGDRVKVKPTGEIKVIDDIEREGYGGNLPYHTESGWWSENQLELSPRTIEDVQEDDLITDGQWFRRVLGRAGKAVFTTSSWEKGEPEDGGSLSWNINQLKESNYTIVQDTPEVVELTLEDVAKLKGIDVKNLKIIEK